MKLCAACLVAAFAPAAGKLVGRSSVAAPAGAPSAAPAASGPLGSAPPAPAGPPPWEPTPSLYDKNGVEWTQGMCFSRERQSPINFDTHIKDPPSETLEYHYEPLRNVQFQMQARGGLVFIDMTPYPIGGVSFDGYIYPLVRIDFHANSEHLIKGRRYSMEMQLVHRRLDDPKKALIVAVPVWSENTPHPPSDLETSMKEYLTTPFDAYYPPVATDPDFNPLLQQFLTVRPPSHENEVVNVVIPATNPIDMGFFLVNPIIPESAEYIQYSGSLTTPPCYDLTTWFVRRRPMLASNAQTKAFADSIFRLTNKKGNFRAVMPVNQRPLSVYKAKWVVKLPYGTKSLPLGPNARTDTEYQAERMAANAKELSQDAVDYMVDFGTRLRRSARDLQDHLDKGRNLLPPVDTNTTSEDEWKATVLRMRSSMQGIVQGVQGTVDKAVRAQTMKTHKKAAVEGARARRMTMAWKMD